MKRWISLLLILTLLLTVMPLPAGAVADVPDTWAEPEIQLAVAHGLVPDDFLHSYKADITRKDFCRLVILLVEQITGETAAEFITSQGLVIPAVSPFDDISDSDVTKAWVLGIINGDGYGNFMPTRSITRQEAAKMLRATALALGRMPAGTATAFTDASTIASWAIEGVDFVSGLGVMKGTSGGAFSPKNPYQRQMAYMTMNRMYEALVNVAASQRDRVNPTTFLRYQLGNAESLSFSYDADNGKDEVLTTCAFEGDRAIIRFPGPTMTGVVDVIELVSGGFVTYAIPSTGKAAQYTEPASDVLLWTLQEAVMTVPTMAYASEDATWYEYRVPFIQDDSQDLIYHFKMQDNVLVDASCEYPSGYFVYWTFSAFSTDDIPDVTFELPAGLTYTHFDYSYDYGNPPFWFEDAQ